MRNVLLSVVLFSFAFSTAVAADTYSCRVKEQLLLNEDGIVRAKPKMDWSPNFMIDKITGNAVGEVFLGSPTWPIMQQGSTVSSLMSQGRVMGQWVYKVVVYSFSERKEKPFFIDNRGSEGVFEIFTGTCK
jgi:hypothetical protein